MMTNAVQHCLYKSTSILQILLALIVAVVSVAGCSGRRQMTPVNLKTEYLSNPVGLDVSNPRFSWIPSDPERGGRQTAYQIIVSDSRADVENGAGPVWDSGKVPSEATTNITYEGENLSGSTSYWWRVRLWDREGEAGSWSEVQHFQTGILDASDWQAEWITHPDSAVSSPLLRDEFSVSDDKEIESAYVYVTGMGYYELYLNGEKVGDHVLDPAITNYNKRILYETYDVTGKLGGGANVLGLWLGNGAYRIKAEEGRWTWFSTNNDFGEPAGWVQLHIRFADGSEQVVTTDRSWTASSSPITYNNVYGGEDYDARLEQQGWSETGFDDTSWQPVRVAEKPGTVLDSQLMPPIRVTQTLEPVATYENGSGTYLYDLGQNIPGWWRIRVNGEAGTKLKIRGAETLNDSLFPTPLKPGDSLSTDKAYHSDVWTGYTMKGGEEEIYEPRFFYTGFRYVEVQADRPSRLASLQVEGRAVHSDLERNGHFSSSDTLLNRIYKAAIWSQRGNLHGYPTDCPHREKGGYNGDGQVIAEASLHDFHMHALYDKWLNDMRDSQYENGRIPNTSPTMLGGMGGGIAWGSAYILLPHWVYLYYGDERILSDHYASMEGYMEYLRNLASNDEHPEEPYIIDEFGGYWDSLGEWEAPVGDRTGPVNPLTNTYYWYLDAVTFADIAGVLGKQEVSRRYLALADSIKGAFNRRFFRPETGLYGTDEVYEGYLLFALAGDLVPDGYRRQVLDNLVSDIMVSRSGHLGTGILGTKHLFEVLGPERREDVLHRVVTRTTYPSWGYWLENGATTLWESWDAESSHNHQMFGSVNEYFYKYLAGIRAPGGGETSPGYGDITIRPYVPEGLEHAGAGVTTVRGTVSSRWEREEEGLRLTVGIPANTTGRIYVPVLGLDNPVLSEGGVNLWVRDAAAGSEQGITGITRDDGYLVVSVLSGQYEFRLSGER